MSDIKCIIRYMNASRSLVKLRPRQQIIERNMDIQAARLEDAEWIHVAQDRDMKRVWIIP